MVAPKGEERKVRLIQIFASSQLLIFHHNPTLFAHRSITRVEDAVHDVAIFVGLARRSPIAHAFDEMFHLRLISIGECFLGQRPRPAMIDVCFLHDVTGGLRRKALNRRHSRDVRKNGAFCAMYLIAEVENKFKTR